MKQLFYTIRYLFRRKENNSVKIISLTIGLVVSVVLFSLVAFEMSYDSFYPEKDNLYMLHAKWQVKNGTAIEGVIINSPFAPTMSYEFDEVESATVMMYGSVERTYTLNDSRYTGNMIMADTLFFSTLGLKLPVHNPEMMKPGAMLVSRSFSRLVFGEKDPVGEVLMKEENRLTVAGVFEDMPRNSHLQFDVVELFIPNMANWQSNDAYTGYIRLRPGVDPQTVDAKIPDMMRRHYDVDAENRVGTVRTYSLLPVTEYHRGDPEVRRTCLILSVLAFSLLFAAAMNYILISVSSLTRRAKSVGVHKCYGAGRRDIFRMFMNETFVLLLFSLVLSAFIILVFRSPVESLIKTELAAIITVDNLWVTVTVVVLLFITTGVMPGRIFSSVPVTQVFHTYSDNKRQWKRILLFAQFSGITFILTLLFIVVFQYHLMINKDLGYRTENILYTKKIWNMTGEQLQTAKEELLRFPEVESVALSSDLPLHRYSGSSVQDMETKKDLFMGYFMTMDEDYLDTYELKLVAGNNLSKRSDAAKEIVVNETSVRMLNLDNPVGAKISYLGELRTICGVVKDFQNQSYYKGVSPIFLMPDGTHEDLPVNRISVKLNVPLTAGITEKLSGKLKELSNDGEAAFISYMETYRDFYKDARSFRNSIAVASGLMLSMMLLGLWGFVADEVGRRRKEIALRKINGARISDILVLLSKEISYIALPAIILGLLFSYATGTEWLKQFAVKIPMNMLLFTASGL
ncbi:MAG: ABC transporter permease, partial [Tannerella sp.]|nr:ABC transporter permease [Tannerella sp.]